jgi:hypothetical protein
MLDLSPLLATDVLMKAATLAGVALGALGMNLARLGFSARIRCAALGLLGVALMVGNAWLAPLAWALPLDAAYALASGLALAQGLLAARRKARAPAAVQPASAPAPSAARAPAAAPAPLIPWATAETGAAGVSVPEPASPEPVPVARPRSSHPPAR